MMPQTTARMITNRTTSLLLMTTATKQSSMANLLTNSMMSANCRSLSGCWIDLNWIRWNGKVTNWRDWNSIHWNGLNCWSSQEESRVAEIQIRSWVEAKQLESGKDTFDGVLFRGRRSPSEHSRRTL